jgi:hypothetical protein
MKFLLVEGANLGADFNRHNNTYSLSQKQVNIITEGLDITIPIAAGQLRRTDVSQPFLFLDDRPDFWAQSSTRAPLLSRQ